MADGVRVKRIYEAPAAADGARVLVDRLWPRGVAKDRAEVSEWLKAVAPSAQLRKWFDHDPDKFDEFARRYRAELGDEQHAEALARLRTMADAGRLTLLTATRAVDISAATVLRQVLTPEA